MFSVACLLKYKTSNDAMQRNQKFCLSSRNVVAAGNGQTMYEYVQLRSTSFHSMDRTVNNYIVARWRKHDHDQFVVAAQQKWKGKGCRMHTSGKPIASSLLL